MAFKIEREQTQTTPYILVDEEKGYIRFEGESYLEDIVSFYSEINSWLKEYLPTDFTGLTFDCAMEYFNSSTTKQIYNMLRTMDKNASGKKIIINWIVNNSKNDMLIECGEDFREEMKNLEFNIIIKD